MMELYQLAIECKNFSDKNVRYTIIKNGNSCYQLVTGASKQYETLLLSLCGLLKDRYSTVAEDLRKHVVEYDDNKLYHQTAIDAIVNCVISFEESLLSENNNLPKRKVFISHSSKDVKLVKEFVDKILLLGIGLQEEDVFCTSIEGLNIKNGEDIREHIKKNILTSNYSFLMISDNYKRSEICLNEMGAVWFGDNKVRYYLLPNTGFDKIGWLCDTKQAEKIDSPITLDGIRKELVESYNLVEKQSWSRYRQDFVDSVVSVSKDEMEDKVRHSVNEASSENISDRIVELLMSKKSLSTAEIAVAMKISERTVNRILNNLMEKNIVVTTGAFVHNRKWELAW